MTDLLDEIKVKWNIPATLPMAVPWGKDDVVWLVGEIERLRVERERSTDWYQQRFNRLRQWVKEEVEPLSKEVAHRYFAICANGSPAPHESADWQETMHALRLERDQAVSAMKKAVAALANVTETEKKRLLAVAVNHGAHCPIYDGQRCTCGYGLGKGAYWPASEK